MSRTTGRSLVITALFVVPGTMARADEMPVMTAPPAITETSTAPALPEPPPGFSWQRLEKTGAAFLQPQGWTMRTADADEGRAFYITPPSAADEFTTGLKVVVLERAMAPADAVAAAQRMRDRATAGARLEGAWKSEKSGVSIFTAHTERDAEGEIPATSTMVAVAGNGTTGTIYWIVFTSPTAEWEAAWKTGETMMDRFRLDPAY